MNPIRISIIGAGNVAHHLAKSLDAKHHVAEVYSRNIAHARELAEALADCRAIDDLSQISRHSDLYLIAVADDAIAEIAKQLPPLAGLVAHVSGSVPMQAVSGISARYGVLYPLQTFSKAASVDVSQVPFFVEGSTPAATDALAQIAREIGASATVADSQLRRQLHIAAVFACNFTNHMYAIAAQLLSRADLDFSVLGPLLRTTLAKALAQGPEASQTGPAARGDMAVMQSHEASLDAEQRQIYHLISQSIMQQYKK